MTLADRIAQRSPAARYTLALSLLVVIGLIAWHDLIMPMPRLLTSQHRWRNRVRTELAVARGQAAEVPALQKLLAALPREPIWQRFYPVATSASASAIMREDITRYAAAAAVTIRSIRPLPESDKGHLSRLGVSVSTVTTIDQLTKFLSKLRTSPRYLRVDALRVTAPQVQIAKRNPHLLVRLQIFGYSRSQARGTK